MSTLPRTDQFPAERPRKACIMQYEPMKFVLIENFWPGIKEIGNITIPQGFRTDLYSTPRILWSIFPPHELPIEAALIHDHAWAMGLREIGNKYFYIAMKAYGVSKFKAKVYTSAVRNFGNSQKSQENYKRLGKMSHREIHARL